MFLWLALARNVWAGGLTDRLGRHGSGWFSIRTELRRGFSARIRTRTCRATLLSSSASAFSQWVINARARGETLRLMTERL
jgi:hypothetical protein